MIIVQIKRTSRNYKQDHAQFLGKGHNKRWQKIFEDESELGEYLAQLNKPYTIGIKTIKKQQILSITINDGPPVDNKLGFDDIWRDIQGTAVKISCNRSIDIV